MRQKCYKKQKDSTYDKKSHNSKVNRAELFKPNFNEREGKCPKDDWKKYDEIKIFFY